MDRFGGAMAHAHSLNGAARASRRVTASEHAGHGGGEGLLIVGDGSAPRALDIFGQEAEVGHLADGQDDGIGFHLVVGTVDGDGLAAAAGIGLAQAHAQQLQPASATVALQDTHGVGEQLQGDALLLRLVHFEGVGGHLGARAAIDDGAGGTQAESATGRIDGRITTAHHHDLVPYLGALARIDAPQKVDGRIDAGEVFARDAHGRGIVSADAQQDGIIFLAQGGEILYRGVGENRNTAICDALDLLIEDILGQAIVGDAIAEHPSGLGLGFVDRYLIAQERQVLRGRQATGPGPHDGDLLLAGDRHTLDGRVAVLQRKVGDEAFQGGDGHSRLA